MGSTPKKPWASFIRRDPKTTSPAAAEGSGAAGGAKPKGTANPVLPYDLSDPIPKPEAVEKNTDSGWAIWTELANSENRKFADTTPPTEPMRLSDDERSYAATVPGALQAALQAEPKAPPRRELTVVEVMVEARLNNRVCPKPARWQQLYEMLPEKKQIGAGWEPAPPLIDAAWDGTPSIPKRMCFREHIEWAASHDFLQETFTFMKSLPEDEWHHMGE